MVLNKAHADVVIKDARIEYKEFWLSLHALGTSEVDKSLVVSRRKPPGSIGWMGCRLVKGACRVKKRR